MDIATFLKTYWMLPERTKKWLACHPERFEEFTAEFQRDPYHFLRQLTYMEIRAIEEAEHAAHGYEPFVLETNAAVVELGLKMAEFIHEIANREEGFMRYLRRTAKAH
jgi:hypothetical protein